MFTSIKAKIIIFHITVLFSILSVLGIFLYLSLDRIVYDAIDSSLLSKAKTLTTLINTDVEDETEFKRSDEVRWEYSSPKSTSYFQIRRIDGFTLEKSPSLKGSELPYSANEERTDFKTIRVNGALARLVDFHAPAEITYAAKNGDQGVVIQCAEDIGNQVDLLQRYRLVLSLSILSIMIISALGGLMISKKALAPVKDISGIIDKISESNLSERINLEYVPKELRILASSFNHTFDRLERAFSRQRQFAADASHELRTPLSVILSQSEVTLRRDRTAGEYREALAAVGRAARMMSDTVRKLLTLARLGADKVDLQIEHIRLVEIIRESVKLLTPLADRNGISITVSADAHAVVRGDRAALLELFGNLIDNAITYNIPRGNVDISAEEENGIIVATIRDTGIGISGENLDKVFDRFYRVDKSRSKERDGAGLGLSICNEIAKLHGGKIEIASTLGTGTTVSVFLKEGRSGMER